MREKLLLGIGLTLLTCLPTTVAFESLTMEECVNSALGINPEIQAERFETQAAMARPSQAATPPDPEFMVDFIGVPTNTTDVSQGAVQYMISQQIPFPSKLVYGYKAEKQQALAQQARTVKKEQDIIRETKRAYIELWRLQEEERINRSVFSIFQKTKGSAETAYATTNGGIADPVRAAVELGDIEGQLAIIEQERLEALATLSKTIARPLDSSIRVKAPQNAKPIAKIENLINLAKTSRPELSEADHLIETQKAKRSLAKSQYAPDLTLRWGYMDNPSGNPNAWYGRVGVSVPLWAFSKQHFGVREAETTLKRAEASKSVVELSTESDIRMSFAKLMGSEKVVRVYTNKVVPQARLLVASLRESYRLNQVSFIELAQGIRSLNNAELTLIRARADEAKAYADLERAVGMTALQEVK